jgi:hypothetical protein
MSAALHHGAQERLCVRGTGPLFAHVEEHLAQQHLAQQHLAQQHLAQQHLAQQHLAQQHLAQQHLAQQHLAAHVWMHVWTRSRRTRRSICKGQAA